MDNSDAVGYGIEVDGIHYLFLGKVPDFDSREECKGYFLKLVKEKEKQLDSKQGGIKVVREV